MRWLSLLVVLVGCHAGQGEYLDGSLVEVFALTWDHTRARLYESELSLEWADSARQDQVALRVTAPNDGRLSEGKLDLVADGHVGMSDEAGTTLPGLESGELVLSHWEELEGGRVKGHFGATFEDADGIRLSVVGGFDTGLEMVDVW